MPDRMIRDEILSSARWLELPRNTHRLAFVACLLVADDNGNFECGTGSLVRLWRDFGIETRPAALEVLESLVAAGLVQTYDLADKNLSTGENLSTSKRYGHIPRFRQRVRYVRSGNPLPPWQIGNDIKTDRQKKPDHGQTEARPKTDSSPTQVGTSEVKRSEVKRSEGVVPIGTSSVVDNLARKLKNGINPNGQNPDQPPPPWNRFRPGIEAKCDEVGVPHNASDSDEVLVKACNVAMATKAAAS